MRKRGIQRDRVIPRLRIRVRDFYGNFKLPQINQRVLKRAAVGLGVAYLRRATTTRL